MEKALKKMMGQYKWLIEDRIVFNVAKKLS